MPEDLNQVATAAPENVKITGMRVLAERLLHLQRQPVHAAPHVRVADRQPDAFDGVQLGAVGRQEDEADVVGDGDAAGSVPTGAVEQQRGVRVLGIRPPRAAFPGVGVR